MKQHQIDPTIAPDRLATETLGDAKLRDINPFFHVFESKYLSNPSESLIYVNEKYITTNTVPFLMISFDLLHVSECFPAN